MLRKEGGGRKEEGREAGKEQGRKGEKERKKKGGREERRKKNYASFPPPGSCFAPRGDCPSRRPLDKALARENLYTLNGWSWSMNSSAPCSLDELGYVGQPLPI